MMGRIKNTVKGESSNYIVLDDETEENRNILHLYIITPQDGRKTRYKFRNEGRIKNVLLAHCNKYDIDYDTAQYLYNGKKLKAKKTPTELGMKDGDEILLMMPKSGG